MKKTLLLATFALLAACGGSSEEVTCEQAVSHLYNVAQCPLIFYHTQQPMTFDETLAACKMTDEKSIQSGGDCPDLHAIWKECLASQAKGDCEACEDLRYAKCEPDPE